VGVRCPHTIKGYKMAEKKEVKISEEVTQVVEETNKTASKAFPIILNTNHPYFFWYLEQCAVYNQKIIDLNKINDWGIIKFFQKIPLVLMIFWYMFKIFLIKPIDTEATRQQVC
jgi:magnesium-protoporphyrin IX monomethyl ester (oxidative) cyclase